MPIRIRYQENKYQATQVVGHTGYRSSIRGFKGMLYGSETGDPHTMRIGLIIVILKNGVLKCHTHL